VFAIASFFSSCEKFSLLVAVFGFSLRLSGLSCSFVISNGGFFVI